MCPWMLDGVLSDGERASIITLLVSSVDFDKPKSIMKLQTPD